MGTDDQHLVRVAARGVGDDVARLCVESYLGRSRDVDDDRPFLAWA
jgi:hypothetical protein